MKTKASTLTPRMLSDFCEKRLAPVLSEEVVKRLHQYMGELLAQQEYPPYRGAGVDLTAVAETLSLDLNILKPQKAQITPVFDAIARAVAEGRLREGVPSRQRSIRREEAGSAVITQTKRAPNSGKGPGRQRRPVIEFPDPLFTEWDEPDSFGAALRLHASRHGETTYHLFDAVVRPKDGVNRSTVISWGRGTKMPRAAISLGSRLIDRQSQKMTVAARATAERKVFAHRS
jgi:hypothetical protein